MTRVEFARVMIVIETGCVRERRDLMAWFVCVRGALNVRYQFR